MSKPHPKRQDELANNKRRFSRLSRSRTRTKSSDHTSSSSSPRTSASLYLTVSHAPTRRGCMPPTDRPPLLKLSATVRGMRHEGELILWSAPMRARRLHDRDAVKNRYMTLEERQVQQSIRRRDDSIVDHGRG